MSVSAEPASSLPVTRTVLVAPLDALDRVPGHAAHAALLDRRCPPSPTRSDGSPLVPIQMASPTSSAPTARMYGAHLTGSGPPSWSERPELPPRAGAHRGSRRRRRRRRRRLGLVLACGSKRRSRLSRGLAAFVDFALLGHVGHESYLGSARRASRARARRLRLQPEPPHRSMPASERPGHPRDLVVEVGRALDAQVVVLEVDPLVGRVGVLVGLAEAHEQARLAGRVGDRAHERDAPALADEDGGLAERLARRRAWRPRRRGGRSARGTAARRGGSRRARAPPAARRAAKCAGASSRCRPAPGRARGGSSPSRSRAPG